MARAHVELQLRWGDQDAYGHVNNVAYARLLEEARVRALWMGAAVEETGLERHFNAGGAGDQKMLVASQHIEYVRVLDYSVRPVVVEMWIGKLGGANLEIHCEILDGAAADRTVVARAITVAVMVDSVTMRPSRITDAARDAVAAWTDEPLRLRRG
ncbi:acyl-CoA thioesterase [Leucobacter komagatae]|uniref:Thioesterase n=1 Tax=Leucobacter komagatae TaxID=55969 RepID=A0A0D0ILG7_9MICO|nr:thioesterase family protein [Leucobacter komagatae]KIP52429.1 thioesterase [Leucobacter komagatae]